MKQVQVYSRSTVAMTAYNIIVDLMRQRDIRLNSDFIFLVSKQRHLYELDKDLFDKSIRKLVAMGYVNYNGTCYTAKDSQLRHVTNRNLEDIELDGDGVPRGGWRDWKVKDLVRGLISIEGVINGIH